MFLAVRLFCNRSCSAINYSTVSNDAVSCHRVNFYNFFNSNFCRISCYFSLRSFVTARSERNSCESYEHKC